MKINDWWKGYITGAIVATVILGIGLPGNDLIAREGDAGRGRGARTRLRRPRQAGVIVTFQTQSGFVCAWT